MKKVVNFVGFQIVWFAAVFGAAGGNFWIGPIAVLVWLAVHIHWSESATEEILIALTALGLGLLSDTILIGTGVYKPRGLVPGWPVTPPWMLALWVNFGTLVNGSLGWLRGRYLLGAFLGAWGGPMAYYSGHRLGALQFPTPLLPHLILLGAAWAAAVPLLFFLAEQIRRCLLRRTLPGSIRE